MFRVATFLINLDRSPSGWPPALASSRLCRMPFTRVAAVDGRKVGADHRVDAQRYRRRHGREVRPGEIGCYLSHITAMQAFLAADASHALILEDDATLLPSLPDVLARATSREAVGTWDVLKLESRRTGFKLALLQLTATHTLCVNLFPLDGRRPPTCVSRHAARVYLDKLLPIGQRFDTPSTRLVPAGLRMRGVAPLVRVGAVSASAAPVDHRWSMLRSSSWPASPSCQSRLPHRDGDHARRLRHLRCHLVARARRSAPPPDRHSRSAVLTARQRRIDNVPNAFLPDSANSRAHDLAREAVRRFGVAHVEPRVHALCLQALYLLPVSLALRRRRRPIRRSARRSASMRVSPCPS